MFLSKTKLILVIVLGLLIFLACAPRKEVKKEPPMEKFEVKVAEPKVAELKVEVKVAELKITKITLTTGVKDREPVSSAITFPNSVGRVYCWTLIEGAKEPTAIRHLWYYGEKKVVEVSLEIKSSPYRTWSSKTILPQWKGDWRVGIVDDQDNLLGTAPFKIE